MFLVFAFALARARDRADPDLAQAFLGAPMFSYQKLWAGCDPQELELLSRRLLKQKRQIPEEIFFSSLEKYDTRKKTGSSRFFIEVIHINWGNSVFLDLRPIENHRFDDFAIFLITCYLYEITKYLKNYARLISKFI
jgi:hypothetical protein